MSRVRSWRSGLAAAAIAAACGGEVVVTPDAGVGGTSRTTVDAASSDQSAEASSSETVTTGSVAESSSSAEASAVAASSSTGALAPDTCVLACKTASSCIAHGSTELCEAGCASVAPACAPAHQAWLQCMVTNGFAGAVGCPSVAACEPLLWSYVICAGGCVGGSCGASPSGSCGCQSNCVGSFFETSCFPGEPGFFGCQCKQNGVVVGNCYGPGTSKTCDAIRSCCAGAFFVDG